MVLSSKLIFKPFSFLVMHKNVIFNNFSGYFDNLFFPYVIQYAYRSPVVALQIKNVKRNCLFFITCRLINLITPTVPLNFEILID